MAAVRYLFPEGKTKVLTMSYDDGVVQDRKLIGIFNKYGIKGTFHINSALLDRPNKVTRAEVKDLYAGHEVAIHTATHPFPERVPEMDMMREVWEDRKALEDLVGYPVVGMSYPMGTYNQKVIDICKAAGIVYSRTVENIPLGRWPEDFMKWHSTCHQSRCLEFVESFKNAPHQMAMFYVWGHAYEFDREDFASRFSWKDMENFCEQVSNLPDCWYATNIQIYRYITAIHSLVVTCDGKRYYNPTDQKLWYTFDDKSKYATIEPGSCGEF